MVFSKKNSNVMSPHDFFIYSVQYLHDAAKKLGFANEGLIFNEGLIQLGNPIIAEWKNTRNMFDSDNEYYYSISTSLMQTGFVLARQLYIDKESLETGRFFDENPSPDDLYKKLLIGLKEDLNISYEQWDEFRHKIIPLFSELISDYLKLKDANVYVSKLFSAYYILGISIGLEKYES